MDENIQTGESFISEDANVHNAFESYQRNLNQVPAMRPKGQGAQRSMPGSILRNEPGLNINVENYREIQRQGPQTAKAGIQGSIIRNIRSKIQFSGSERVSMHKMMGRSASRQKNPTVIDLTQPSTSQHRSPQTRGQNKQSTISPSSRLQTQLSNTQQMRINNPFGHSNEVSMPTMVDRLVTAVGFTGITQNTQETYRGGQNKQSLGFTQRINPHGTTQSILGMTQTQITQRQNSPVDHSGYRQQLGSTTAMASVAQFHGGETQTTRVSGANLSRLGGLARHGSLGQENFLNFQGSTQQVSRDTYHQYNHQNTLTYQHTQQTLRLKNKASISQQPRRVPAPNPIQNIQRIIQNNIIESDIERENGLRNGEKDKLKLDLAKVAISPLNIDGLQEAPAEKIKYEDLDTMRAMQLHQQPTERLKFDTKNCGSFLIHSSQSSLPDPRGAEPRVVVTQENQIEETLALLQSQSPFKNMQAADQEELLPSIEPRNSLCVSENILDTLDIDASFIDLGIDQAAQPNLNQSKGKLPQLDLDKIKQEERNTQQIKPQAQSIKQATIQQSNQSQNTTERQTMGTRDKMREEAAVKPEEEHSKGPGNMETGLHSERQKFFNLMVNNHKTLGQKILEGIPNRSGIARKKQQSFIENNEPSSSFDSVDPAGLVIQTNYNSQVSKVSKISRILNGQYLASNSSNMSSFYHSRNMSKDSCDSQDKMDEQEERNKIELWLKKIDKNLNTFTTEQFEQLREDVKIMGFNRACVLAQQQFDFQKGSQKNIEISFVSESDLAKQIENTTKKESTFMKEDFKGSILSSVLSSVGERQMSEQSSIIQQNISSLDRIEDSNKVQPLSILHRNIVMAEPNNNELSQPTYCTGFLSAPMIIFDQNTPDDQSETDAETSNVPNHKATILNYKETPPNFSSYLPMKLLSNKMLMAFKNKCLQLSCGFEHCLALLHSGEVLCWGYGGSGCLGHGNYRTIQDPKRVEAITKRSIYIEAGGYHNIVIAKDDADQSKSVYAWGRGDVGQLGVKTELLTKDQMGLVSLLPLNLDFPEFEVNSAALGDAHTLFLSEKGQVYSCGWHELGQLGITKEQREQDALKGIDLHPVGISTPIKQISCGAVFSIALAHNSDVYVWGSNNNGQMGGCAPGQPGQDNVATQNETPIKLPVDGRAIKNILCGDCHVIVETEPTHTEKSKIYAWGQGQIIEETETGKIETQDVICNQPIMINTDIENKMIFQMQDEAQMVSISPIKINEDLFQPQILQNDSNDLKQDINSYMLVAQGTVPKDKLAQAFTSIVPSLQLNNIDKCGGSMDRPKKHKNVSYQTPESDNIDLITIKNTEDYNNFLKKREAGAILSDEHRASMIQFEQRMRKMMQNESSAGTGSNLDQGTSGRGDVKDRSGEYGSVIILEDYQYQPKSNVSQELIDKIQLMDKIKVNQQELKDDYRTGMIKGSELVQVQRAQARHNTQEFSEQTDLAYSISNEPSKQLLAAKRSKGTLENVFSSTQNIPENLGGSELNSNEKLLFGQSLQLEEIKELQMTKKNEARNQPKFESGIGQIQITEQESSNSIKHNISDQSSEIARQMQKTHSLQNIKQAQQHSSSKKSKWSASKESSKQGDKHLPALQNDMTTRFEAETKKQSATSYSKVSNSSSTKIVTTQSGKNKLNMLKSQNVLMNQKPAYKKEVMVTNQATKLELQRKRLNAGSHQSAQSHSQQTKPMLVAAQERDSNANQRSEIPKISTMDGQQFLDYNSSPNAAYQEKFDQTSSNNFSSGKLMNQTMLNYNRTASNISQSQSSLPHSGNDFENHGQEPATGMHQATSNPKEVARNAKYLFQSSGGTGETGRQMKSPAQAQGNKKQQLSLKNKTSPTLKRTNTLGIQLGENNQTISVSSKPEQKRSRSPTGKQAKDIKISPKRQKVKGLAKTISSKGLLAQQSPREYKQVLKNRQQTSGSRGTPQITGPPSARYASKRMNHISPQHLNYEYTQTEPREEKTGSALSRRSIQNPNTQRSMQSQRSSPSSKKPMTFEQKLQKYSEDSQQRAVPKSSPRSSRAAQSKF